MQTSPIEFKIDNAGKDITIRQGEAAKVFSREPNILRIAGDIHTVSTFLKGRKDGHSTQEVDQTKALVLSDFEKGKIELHLDPESAYGAVISGELKLADELKPFGINTPSMFSKEQLIKLIRFNKVHFASEEQYASVLTGYQSFTAKTTGDIKEENDKRGNRIANFAKTTETSVPKEFVLDIPIYRGEGKKKFTVEIYMEVTDAATKFWLESTELHQLLYTEKEKLFNEEFAQCLNLVIVKQ